VQVAEIVKGTVNVYTEYASESRAGRKRPPLPL